MRNVERNEHTIEKLENTTVNISVECKQKWLKFCKLLLKLLTFLKSMLKLLTEITKITTKIAKSKAQITAIAVRFIF